MQLAVDIGNSRVKFGLFEGEKLVRAGSEEMDVVFIIKDLYESDHSFDSIIISSVNEAVDPDLIPIPETIHHVMLESHTPLPLQLDYQTPETLGNDRIALAVAGIQLFPGKNLLLIDAGTCLTMDVVTDKGVFIGGIISPGIDLRLKSMHEGTARLPLLNFDRGKWPERIGKNTADCMLIGAVKGIINEIDGTISSLGGEFKNLKVLLTGGDSRWFETELKSSIFADPNLVLSGLNQILLYNLPKK